MKPRLGEKSSFDETIKGTFGSFGSGGGVQVNFVQAAVSPADLGKISLVGEIEGSDRWPVRDLFQREVDSERVEQSLLPWLQDKARVKFFNPLTLVLIPFDPAGKLVRSQIPHLEREVKADLDGDDWIELRATDLYRFRWRVKESREYPEFAEVAWDSHRVRLVAIDGQHRLSALKRYMRDAKGPGYSEFLKWHIPVVIAGLHRESVALSLPGSRSAYTALDVIRHVFVNINTQAQVPTRTRQILLDDTSPIHICVQELLQSVHENDIRAPGNIDLHLPPLLLFDWRGATRGGKETHSPIALKSVSELTDWLEWYVLGESFSSQQMDVLGIDETHELREQFASETLRPRGHLVLRDIFKHKILPGILHLLKEFTPYKNYITKLREIEQVAHDSSDASRHALSLLRFGTHHGADSEQANILRAANTVVREILDAREANTQIPQLLADDIGMRGVVYAFGALHEPYCTWAKDKNADSWRPYSEWFVKHLNQMEAEGWFVGAGHPHRQYITHTPAGDVINFKLDHAHRALGAFTLLVVAAYAGAGRGSLVTRARFEELWSRHANNDKALQGTLRSGYRKRYMEELGQKHPMWERSRKETEAGPLANKAAVAHLGRLRKALDTIVQGK
ncbi:MAG: hypothetical protein JW395_4171 [Nitrospira sp.]|nr:hypothetical protein [Nitrospira sp.]